MSSRSESPRVHEILLRQQLKEDIEKNSTGKVRYRDSELNIRNQERSPAFSASEVQSTTLNIGVPSTNNSNKQTSKITITPASSTNKQHATKEKLNSDTLVDSVESGRQHQATNRNCQVCLVKEVRQDLMNINKMVQEQTEQIRQLKTKCLRSYFERQI